MRDSEYDVYTQYSACDHNDRASAFDQDLGWCLDDVTFDPYGYGNDVEDVFYNTPCEPTACGVKTGDCTAQESDGAYTLGATSLAAAMVLAFA